MIQIDLRGKVFAGANRNPVFNEVVTASTYSLFGDYSSIEVEPANGNVPFPTSYVIVATLRSGAVSRIYCNGSLRAVRVIGSTSFTYDDWTEQIALI